MTKVSDEYIIVKGLSFAIAWEIALHNGCITRESTGIRSGAAPGICFEAIDWLKLDDFIANDWMIIDYKRFFADKKKQNKPRVD